MAAVKKKPDYLVDVLQQIQARKTVKPEDATNALQQYKKFQDHIKDLKAEIEVFKEVSEKAKQVGGNLNTYVRYKSSLIVNFNFWIHL